MMGPESLLSTGFTSTVRIMNKFLLNINQSLFELYILFVTFTVTGL